MSALVGALVAATGLALAAPPQHVRAAAAQPEDLRDLDGERVVRVWWDDDGAPAEVEVMRKGRWTVAAEQARPGVSLGRQPAETLVRVRGAEGELSEAVTVRWGLGPAGVARLAAPTALAGAQVADIWPVEAGAWVSLMEGGLAWAPKGELAARSMGAAEGLPSELVLSVTQVGEVLWVGTSAGLARVEGGEVTAVIDRRSGLPDDWVQALAPDGQGGLWVGTFAGLARVSAGGGVSQVGPAAPVFGLSGQGWVGLRGLASLPELRSAPGVDAGVEVWDVAQRDGSLYLATATEGVLELRDDLLLPHWRPAGGAAYALQLLEGRLYVAADIAGLVALAPGVGPVEAWGAAEGLPGHAVVEVERGPPGKLWVGTDAGLALLWPGKAVASWPLSPLAAGGAVSAVVGAERWAILGGARGLTGLGEVPACLAPALALPGPVVALEWSDDALWVVGPEQAWELRCRRRGRGELTRVSLPILAEHAALAAGALYIGGPQGLMRLGAHAQRFDPVLSDGPVTGLSVDAYGDVWVAGGGRVLPVVGVAPQPKLATRGGGLIAANRLGVWVSDSAGTWRLDVVAGELEETARWAWAAVAMHADLDGHLIALTDAGLLVDGLTGAPIPGLPPAGLLGEVYGMEVDAAGRVWLFGERGAMVLPR